LERIPPSDQECRTAALGYLFFPLAVSVLVNVGREPSSDWSRKHAKHALIFGVCSFLFLMVIAFVPLWIVTTKHLDPDGIIHLYLIAFIVDIAALTTVSVYGIRYARPASRGIPHKNT
jgi:hypothetical protein